MSESDIAPGKRIHAAQVDAATGGGASLLGRFAAMAAARAASPACAWGDKVLTYGELDRASSLLAARIVESPGGARAPVALFLDRSCEVLIGCLAAAKAGVPYVPMNMSWPGPRTRNVLAAIKATVALTSVGQPVPPEHVASLTVLEIDATAAQSRNPAASIWRPPLDVPSSTPLYILFTSGSTGEPKGVVVTHGNVAQFVASPECPGFRPGDRVTSACATAFDLSVAETWGGILNGCTLVCCPRETFLDSRRFLEFVRSRRLDHAVLPTAVFNALASQDASIFGTLDKLILCGELPSSALCRKVQATAPPRAFYNTYGPTECTVFVTVERLGLVDETAIIPAGKPMPAAFVRIVDQEGGRLGPGQWGEVVVGGLGVAAGYFNDPERTARAFIPDPEHPEMTVYRTGDRGMLMSDGRLLVSGRFDDQVKIAGMRVELGEIKTLLNAAPGVHVCHIVHSAENGVTAYAVMSAPPLESEEAVVRKGILEYLGGRLPQPMLPRHILFVPSLPLNANGKVDAARLPPPPVCRRPPVPDVDAPGVLGVFRAALRDDSFSLEDSFLACGGNSLLAAALIGTLHRQTGVWVPLEYFSRPRTAQLVQLFLASARAVVPVPARHQIREQVRF